MDISIGMHEGDVTKVNRQSASPREERIITQLIYNAIFRPGEEIDGFTMLSFEEAQLQELGDFDRAMEAAACVVLHKSPRGRGRCITLPIRTDVSKSIAPFA
jgi:hypothetical protein